MKRIPGFYSFGDIKEAYNCGIERQNPVRVSPSGCAQHSSECLQRHLRGGSVSLCQVVKSVSQESANRSESSLQEPAGLTRGFHPDQCEQQSRYPLGGPLQI